MACCLMLVIHMAFRLRADCGPMFDVYWVKVIISCTDLKTFTFRVCLYPESQAWFDLNLPSSFSVDDGVSPECKPPDVAA